MPLGNMTWADLWHFHGYLSIASSLSGMPLALVKNQTLDGCLNLFGGLFEFLKSGM